MPARQSSNQPQPSGAAVVDFRGGQFRFAKADKARSRPAGACSTTSARDVKDLQEAIARLEGMGIKIDVPYRKGRAATPSPTSPIPGARASK